MFWKLFAQHSIISENLQVWWYDALCLPSALFTIAGYIFPPLKAEKMSSYFHYKNTSITSIYTKRYYQDVNKRCWTTGSVVLFDPILFALQCINFLTVGTPGCPNLFSLISLTSGLIPDIFQIIANPIKGKCVFQYFLASLPCLWFLVPILLGLTLNQLKYRVSFF